jgi:hydrogenase nickel incorporation protein HypA/HybF
MHELAITESVVEAVLARTGDRQVTAVRVTVGRLAGVVADSLQFCFELATAGTTLEGATLEIEEPPGRGHCRACAADFALDSPIPLCACGSADIEIISGRELMVDSVQVVS